MKIDIFNHVAPEPFLRLVERERPEWAAPLRRLRLLWDIEGRLRLLEQWPDLQQVLTLTVPSLEYLAPPEKQVELARTSNDAMADICKRWPDRFPYFIASLPMSNVPAAIEEMDRSIDQLGARGIQLQTSVNGRPLDHPDFFPVFERITTFHGMAVWLHPYRPPSVPDYASEDRSRYEVWQVLGWVYETSAAISRMVLSGLLDRLPTLRVITHHCGGMLPFFAGRADSLWGLIGTRSPDPEYQAAQALVDKQPMSSWLKRLYGDTVLGGARAPLRCGLDFFGAEHVVLASDCPYGPESGGFFIREAIASIEEMGLSSDDKEKLYYGNAVRLLTPQKP